MFSKEDLNGISDDMYTLLIYLNSRIFNPGIMLKGLSIPPSHMKAIFYLKRTGPCPVSKIAKDLIISKPNMTPIIDNLIAEGLVYRYDDPNDRRITMIAPTKKADDLIKKNEKKIKEALAQKIAILDEKDLDTMKRVIPELTEIIMKISAFHG
jgi:DNA-binding MarR family transcriptional regulator